MASFLLRQYVSERGTPGICRSVVATWAVFFWLGSAASVFAAASTPAWAIDARGREGETLTFELKKPTSARSGTTYESRVRYAYSVHDGTALYGQDHYATDGRRGKIVFPAGAASANAVATFKVELRLDDVDEGDGETFSLKLTQPQFEASPGMWLYGFHLPAEIGYEALILDPE